jgi:heme-degrading monooxygenase HmoA
MVISIVTRKTSVSDRGQWQSRLEAALPAILALLKAERGFAGVEYLWGAQDDGQMAQVTRWETLEDCQRYVRGGAAATVALHEDRALPTAPYPNGAWQRRTFEVAASG